MRVGMLCDRNMRLSSIGSSEREMCLLYTLASDGFVPLVDM